MGASNFLTAEERLRFDEAQSRYDREKQAEEDKDSSLGNSIFKYIFGGSLPMADVLLLTPWRLWIVYDMICMWKTNDDTHHPDSRYHTVVHNRGPNDSFTNWERGFGLATLFILFAGGLHARYVKNRREFFKSDEHVINQAEQARVELQANVENIERYFDDTEAKITEKLWKKQQQRPFNSEKEIENTVDGNIQKNHPFVSFILNLPKKPINEYLLKFKDTFGNFAFVFWITWMAAAGMYGIPVVNSAIGIPYVTIASIAVTLSIYASAWLFQSTPDNTQRNNAVAEPNSEDAKKQQRDDVIYNQVENRKHTRFILRNRYDAFKRRISNILDDVHNRNADEIEPLFPNIYKSVDAATSKPRNIVNATIKPVATDELVSLAHYTPEYRRNKLIMLLIHDMVSEATLTFFSLWLFAFALITLTTATAPFSATITLGLTTLNNFVGLPWVTVALGAIAGVMRGLYTYANETKEQYIEDEKFKLKANEYYKPDRLGNTITNRDAFNRLFTAVKIKKQMVLGLQVGLRNADTSNNPGLEFIKNHNLDHIDVSNHNYYDNFQVHQTTSDNIHTFADRAFKFLANSQSWIFITRYFALPTGVAIFAPSIVSIGSMMFLETGPMKLFFIVAGIMGTIGGTLRVLQSEAQRIKTEKTAMVSKLDEYITSLRQADCELDNLQALYNIRDILATNANETDLSQEYAINYRHRFIGGTRNVNRDDDQQLGNDDLLAARDGNMPNGAI